jgi:hypothetical protein
MRVVWLLLQAAQQQDSQCMLARNSLLARSSKRIKACTQLLLYYQWGVSVVRPNHHMSVAQGFSGVSVGVGWE